jgi:ribonuclease HII
MDRFSVKEIEARLKAGLLSTSDLLALQSDGRAGVRKLLLAAERQAKVKEALQHKAETMLHFERALWQEGINLIAGIDEVGRGPLAGPGVAAAVILKPQQSILHLDDSKKLSAQKRQRLTLEIKETAIDFAYGSASPQEIDALNIFQASLLAMRRAVAGLGQSPEHLLIDGGHTIANMPYIQRAIVGGDGKSQSIAAASVLAKTARDQLMDDVAQQFPEYGFDVHAGYPTAKHIAALDKYGSCAIHRQSFAPVKRVKKRLES